MLELGLARFIYSCGSAFRFVEKRLRDWIHMMCPGFVSPGRHPVAKRLLEAVFLKVRAKVIDELKLVDFLTLVSDGWTNRNGKSTVNFMLAGPNMKPALWRSISTGRNQHTSEYHVPLLSMRSRKKSAAARLPQ